MSLVSEIESIVGVKVPGSTFLLSSYFRANVASYDLTNIDTTRPLIVLNNELEEKVNINPNMNLTSETRIQMLFLTKSTVNDKTDREMEDEEISAMRLIAKQIYSIIYQTDSIRLRQSDVLSFTIRPRFRVFNSVLSGVEAEARWLYNEVINVCPNP